jgi:hypothetical protein
LAEIRAAQEELGNRVDRQAAKNTTLQPRKSSALDAVAFAKALGTTVNAGDPRVTHRRPKRRYKTRVHMPSKLDPHVATSEGWPAAEPQLTALAIVGRLSEKHPEQFGPRQHSIVQRLLRGCPQGAQEEAFPSVHCSKATWRHGRCLLRPGYGRLGLSTARPATVPLRRARLETRKVHPAVAVGSPEPTVSLRVTFADEAIWNAPLTVDRLQVGN